MSDEDQGSLISPCACKGTCEFVHYDCLQKYRWFCATKSRFDRCYTCDTSYSADLTDVLPLGRNTTTVIMVPFVLSVTNYAASVYMLFSDDLSAREMTVALQTLFVTPVLVYLCAMVYAHITCLYLEKNKHAIYAILSYLAVAPLLFLNVSANQSKLLLWACRIIVDWFWMAHANSMAWCVVDLEIMD